MNQVRLLEKLQEKIQNDPHAPFQAIVSRGGNIILTHKKNRKKYRVILSVETNSRL